MTNINPNWSAVNEALHTFEDDPSHFAMTDKDVRLVGSCFDWPSRAVEAGKSLAALVGADPRPFLSNVSDYYEGNSPDRYYPPEGEWEESP